MTETNLWPKIAEYARYTPSPHNTQPFRLKILNNTTAEVVFIPSRGLYVGDPEGRFTWLAGGIFVEICTIAAHSLSSELVVKWTLDPMYPDGDHETPQTVAALTLVPQSEPSVDIDAQLLLARHTSRLPYDGKPIPETVIQALQAEARAVGHSFMTSSKQQDIEWIKTLNKNALFNDLNDTGIREELIHWLRFSKKQARATGDGLSAECLAMPGRLLHSFFFHHGFWTMPVVRQIVERIYLSTMKGIGTIAWLQGSYSNQQDWIAAGKLMIRMWLILTKHGLYWHPYGSVITNDKSRSEMLQHLNLADEADGQNMIWLLLRMGYSAEPPHSERLPLEEILL